MAQLIIRARSQENARERNIKVIRNETNRGIPSARNAGFSTAKGEIVAYIDDDCIADSRWLENLFESFDDPKVVAVGGRILPYKTNRFAERYINAIGYGNPAPFEFGESKNPLRRFWVYLKSMFRPIAEVKKPIEVQAVFTANVAYRTVALRDIGGFDQTLLSDEDIDISSRLRKTGARIMFVPNMIVQHRHHESIGKFIKQTYLRSENTLRYYAKEKKIPPIFPIPFLYALLAIVAVTINPIVGLFVILLIPIALYSWWIIRAFREGRLEYLAHPYIQLILETASISGLLRGAFYNLQKKILPSEIKITVRQICLFSIWLTIATLLMVCILNLSPWIDAPVALIDVLLVPGFLLALSLKIKTETPLHYFLYAIGLGFAFLTFGGLAINWLLPFIGISHPLAAFPFMLFMEISVIVLALSAYRRNKNVVLSWKPKPVTGGALFFGIIPLLFLTASILGTIILNNSGSGILTLSMLFGIAAYVIVLGTYKKSLPEWVYGSAIYFTGLSLLLMYALRSPHIIGWDVNQEYQVFQATLKNLSWKMSYYPGLDYNACLSITIVPTLLQQVTKIPSEYIFKLICQIFFAFTPVVLYAFAKRYLSPVLSFLTAFLFLAQTWFYEQMPALIRQEAAFLFYGLILLALFDQSIDRKKRYALFYIFSIAMILSHYSTAYTWLTLTFGVLLLSYVVKLIIKSSRNETMILKPSMFLISLLCLIIWEVPITHTATAAVSFLTNKSGEFQESLSYSAIQQGILTTLLSTSYANTNDNVQKAYQDATNDYGKFAGYKIYPDASLANYTPTALDDRKFLPPELPSVISTPLLLIARINRLSIIDLFPAIGILALYLFWRKRVRDINYQFILLNIVAFGLIGIMLFVPYLQEFYNFTRLYLQMFLILSIAAILGGWFLMKRLPGAGKIILTIMVALVFCSFCGAIDQVTGGQARTTLNQPEGTFDTYYIYDTEVASAEWLAANRDVSDPIQADVIANLRLPSFANLSANNLAIFPSTIEENSYVYLSTANVVRGHGFYQFDNNTLTYNYPNAFLSANKNLIYNDGGSEIYK